LAQKVLQGETKGYRNHPQLTRFLQTSNPLGAIASYLRAVAAEAEQRRYCFDRSRILRNRFRGSIPVSSGQLRYEIDHLLNKLKTRDKLRWEKMRQVRKIEPHPMIVEVRGDIAGWEANAKRPA
jgi:hypothetical protein